MYPTAPSPTRVRYARVRVEGTLATVRSSDQSFTVVAPDGRPVRGWLGEGPSVADLARSVDEPVVLFGVGRFDPAGKLLAIAASQVLPGGPPPRVTRRRGLTPEERRGIARRLTEGFSRWPGDEAGGEDG